MEGLNGFSSNYDHIFRGADPLNYSQYSPVKPTCLGVGEGVELDDLSKNLHTQGMYINLCHQNVNLSKVWKSWPLLIVEWLIRYCGCNEFHSNHYSASAYTLYFTCTCMLVVWINDDRPTCNHVQYALQHGCCCTALDFTTECTVHGWLSTESQSAKHLVLQATCWRGHLWRIIICCVVWSPWLHGQVRDGTSFSFKHMWSVSVNILTRNKCLNSGFDPAISQSRAKKGSTENLCPNKIAPTEVL